MFLNKIITSCNSTTTVKMESFGKQNKLPPALAQLIKNVKIPIIMLSPFIRNHSTDEKNDTVIRSWQKLAKHLTCAIMVFVTVPGLKS